MRRFRHDAMLEGWMKPNFLRELNELIGKTISLPMGRYKYGDRGIMDCVPVTVNPRTSDGYHWPTAIQIRDASGDGMLVIVIPAEIDEDRAPAYYKDRQVTQVAAKLIVEEVIRLVVE